ncbi:MAG: putative 2-dehydropantoate 2-reductase [Cyanobacteria bacterium SW_9_44_58]|nr:MAG: putative 2-dehydropantoate 2-reductase [Cyanobacteria bacterium SW_9_44_58]
MSKRRYAIIGTGAIGGFYGACLQQAGLEVHFLLRSDYTVVKEQGLIVHSAQFGEFTLPTVNAYRDVAQMPPCDVVVVALKATQNQILPEILPHVVKEDGVVLLLQNGLGAEDKIAEIVNTPIVGGLCFICVNKVAPGKIVHLDYGSIKFAEYSSKQQPSGITDNLHAIAHDFQQAGITTETSDDLLQTRWEKLAWNIPFNGLSALLNATTAELMANKATRSLAETLAMEVAQGATANNRHLSAEYLQNLMERTEKMKPYHTSMKLDRDANRPLEVEAIFGNPLEVATEKGMHLPHIAMLYQQLRFVDWKIQQAKRQLHSPL